jgi:hypothetical protein
VGVSCRLAACLALLTASSGCNLVRGPPKDHECRAVLRTIFGLQVAYYSRAQAYSVHPVVIGWAPAPGNRYLYLFDKAGDVTRRDGLPSPPLEDSVGYGPDTKKRDITVEELLPKLPTEVRATLGVEGACPACDVTIACVGNLDADEDVDVWTISTKDRPGAARGTPLHHLKDLP